jgi:hypothetical protein
VAVLEWAAGTMSGYVMFTWVNVPPAPAGHPG